MLLALITVRWVPRQRGHHELPAVVVGKTGRVIQVGRSPRSPKHIDDIANAIASIVHVARGGIAADGVRVAVCLSQATSVISESFRAAGGHPVRLELIESIIREELLVPAVGIINLCNSVRSRVAEEKGSIAAFIMESVNIVVIDIGVVNCWSCIPLAGRVPGSKRKLDLGHISSKRVVGVISPVAVAVAHVINVLIIVVSL